MVYKKGEIGSFLRKGGKIEQRLNIISTCRKKETILLKDIIF